MSRLGGFRSGHCRVFFYRFCWEGFPEVDIFMWHGLVAWWRCSGGTKRGWGSASSPASNVLTCLVRTTRFKPTVWPPTKKSQKSAPSKSANNSRPPASNLLCVPVFWNKQGVLFQLLSLHNSNLFWDHCYLAMNNSIQDECGTVQISRELQYGAISDICHFFYTGSIFKFHPKIDWKHPKTLKNVPEK